MAESFKAFDEQARVKQQQLESARVDRERLINELPKPTSAMYKRIAARIRILLTGRFDPELAETCSPQTDVSEVRDRWQKGL